MPVETIQKLNNIKLNPDNMSDSMTQNYWRVIKNIKNNLYDTIGKKKNMSKKDFDDVLEDELIMGDVEREGYDNWQDIYKDMSNTLNDYIENK